MKITILEPEKLFYKEISLTYSYPYYLIMEIHSTQLLLTTSDPVHIQKERNSCTSGFNTLALLLKNYLLYNLRLKNVIQVSDYSSIRVTFQEHSTQSWETNDECPWH